MRKKDIRTLAQRNKRLNELYGQFGTIVTNLVEHRCSGTTETTSCYWCWYYDYTLEKIVELEDRIARSSKGKTPSSELG